ncbi:MAG: NADH-dependent phenylglyoxylate dehydrogenase subunit alpha [Haliscomenobacter sp.]|jgi:pyruvate/2-oxoacid:ferredoxin oxidoreductase alpha subunit|nr:NADH-dependent phenylglyoxylate dehydrogenase subunit alpha [Haliscomenobacter sp.]
MNRVSIAPQAPPKTKTSLFPRHRELILKGNYAASEAAKLCRVGFVPAYPITPQTSIVERIAEMTAKGEMGATYINMDSEHSVFAAAMGAAIAGERVFTATAGQGLFYAHEVLHAIAHFRLPVVMCNVGRPSIPWNIWSDQSDSLSQRDTGWIQIYGESSQEVLDSLIQAYMLAERVHIPVMVVLDAFYQSHTSENTWVPDQDLVDEFLPPPASQTGEATAVNQHVAFGGLIPPEHYFKFNYSFWKAIQEVEEEAELVAEAFGNHFGRRYHNVEAINIGPQTKVVLVTMSSIATTARGVVQHHPEVGMLKLRLFRPFPAKAILDAFSRLSPDTRIACIERNFLGDREGAVMQEMRRALYGNPFPMRDFYAGLGGKDVPPTTIEKIIHLAKEGKEEVYWVDFE